MKPALSPRLYRLAGWLLLLPLSLLLWLSCCRPPQRPPARRSWPAPARKQLVTYPLPPHAA